MEEVHSTITYVLGGVHLVVTLLIDFGPVLFKLILFRIHGMLKVAVTITPVLLILWVYNNEYETGFYYYLVLAIGIILVLLLPDFKTI